MIAMLNRREFVLKSSLVVVVTAAPRVGAVLVLPLGEAIAIAGRSLISFLIKESLPAAAKRTFMRSAIASVGAGIVTGELLAQGQKGNGQSLALQTTSLVASQGKNLDVEMSLNNPLDQEIAPGVCTLALRDLNSGSLELSTEFDRILVIRRRTFTKLTFEVQALPQLGIKELVLFSGNKEIGKSAQIVVT
jgi:hypothetical protein